MFIHIIYTYNTNKYHQLQNIWYPQSKGVYLPISKLNSILPVANILAHNDITIRYYGKVNSLRLKLNVASKWAGKHLCGVPFILLLIVHLYIYMLKNRECNGNIIVIIYIYIYIYI